MTEIDEDLLHFEQLAEETWPLADAIIKLEKRHASMPDSPPKLKLEKRIKTLKGDFARTLQRDTVFEQFTWPKQGWMVRFEPPVTDGKNKLRHAQPVYSTHSPMIPAKMPMLEMVRGVKPIFSRI